MTADNTILCILCICMVLLFVIALVGYAKTTAAAEAIDSEPSTVYVIPTAAEIVTERPFAMYDVPLDEDTQRYVDGLCRMYGIDIKLVYGVMFAESRFNNSSINTNTGCYGIMQLNPEYYSREKFSDIRRNIYAGTALLAEYLYKYNVDKALMCYKHGERGAKDKWRKCITTEEYCREVTKYAAGIKVKYQIFEEATK